MEKKLAHTALMLVRAVALAGQVLDAYIQSYPKVPNCFLQLQCLIFLCSTTFIPK